MVNGNERIVIDYNKIPKETLKWLEEIKAYKFKSPVLFSVGTSGELHSYEYLVNTPLEKLKERFSYLQERHAQKFECELQERHGISDFIFEKRNCKSTFKKLTKLQVLDFLQTKDLTIKEALQVLSDCRTLILGSIPIDHEDIAKDKLSTIILE